MSFLKQKIYYSILPIGNNIYQVYIISEIHNLPSSTHKYTAVEGNYWNFNHFKIFLYQ